MGAGLLQHEPAEPVLLEGRALGISRLREAELPDLPGPNLHATLALLPDKYGAIGAQLEADREGRVQGLMAEFHAAKIA
jgi:hypothetical protein